MFATVQTELSLNISYFIIYRDAVSTYNIFANSTRLRRFSTSVRSCYLLFPYFLLFIIQLNHLLNIM